MDKWPALGLFLPRSAVGNGTQLPLQAPGLPPPTSSLHSPCPVARQLLLPSISGTLDWSSSESPWQLRSINANQSLGSVGQSHGCTSTSHVAAQSTVVGKRGSCLQPFRSGESPVSFCSKEFSHQFLPRQPRMESGWTGWCCPAGSNEQRSVSVQYVINKACLCSKEKWQMNTWEKNDVEASTPAWCTGGGRGWAKEWTCNFLKIKSLLGILLCTTFKSTLQLFINSFFEYIPLPPSCISVFSEP